jgi:hypothetical protein
MHGDVEAKSESQPKLYRHGNHREGTVLITPKMTFQQPAESTTTDPVHEQVQVQTRLILVGIG